MCRSVGRRNTSHRRCSCEQVTESLSIGGHSVVWSTNYSQACLLSTLMTGSDSLILSNRASILASRQTWMLPRNAETWSQNYCRKTLHCDSAQMEHRKLNNTLSSSTSTGNTYSPDRSMRPSYQRSRTLRILPTSTQSLPACSSKAMEETHSRTPLPRLSTQVTF